MELKEWIVTLYRKEDLDEFYNDMETPGGNLFIPDRAVGVEKRRLISRNTHYMLTREEAELISNDPRVMGVELAEMLDIATRPSYKITSGSFDKRWQADRNDLNWGLLRQSESSNRTNWGDDGSPVITSDLTVTASGKNVDVVIFDGHFDPAHPEFAVNSDGSGGTRVNQYNWFQNDIGSGTGTYVYDRSGSYTNAADVNDNNHGCHVAGTVAGNTQGWARDANIYNISVYSSNPSWGVCGLSSSTYWDYVRAWHNSKPINPETGRKNPTVTNHSYGSYFIFDSTPDNTGPVTRVIYRGVDFNPGRALSTAELQARGFYAPSTSVEVPYYSTSRFVDIQDAINDGIIVVAAAGNESWKIVNSSDQDYNNQFYATYFGSNYVWWLNRGTASGAGYEPVITVGAVSNNLNEVKATFSNCGSQVDVYAAGEAVQSSILTNAAYGGLYAQTDSRNSSYWLGRYQGTSMASPQVCGILACLVESNPNMTQSEAHDWVTTNANSGQMYDSGTDDASDRTSLQGSANLFVRWINQRSETGITFPQKNFKPRPTSGRVYPRPRIRRRG